MIVCGLRNTNIVVGLVIVVAEYSSSSGEAAGAAHRLHSSHRTVACKGIHSAAGIRLHCGAGSLCSVPVQTGGREAAAAEVGEAAM